MATINLTTGSDFREIQYPLLASSFVIDGLAGLDTISFGEGKQSDFQITRAGDGAIQVNSVSGASQTLRVTLYNVEQIQFNNRRTTIDLTTLFDTAAPTVVSASPVDQAVSVPVAADLIFTFSEAIQKGSGSVTISDAAGKVLETIAISSSNITVSGTRLTINPSSDLAYSSSYTVQLSAGAVKDTAGNALAAPAVISFSTGSDPRYAGTANADVFAAAAGQHVVDGGAGVDTLALGAQARAAFSLVHSGNGFVLNALDGSSGYKLTSVERLQFADQSVALDLDGLAGQAAKLLGVVFGGESVSNKGYVGIVLNALDSGMAYEALMQVALDVALGVGASNKAVVDLLYLNLAGVLPSPEVSASFVSLLDSKAITPAALAVAAGEISLNTDHINLAGLYDTGLAYTPA